MQLIIELLVMLIAIGILLIIFKILKYIDGLDVVITGTARAKRLSKLNPFKKRLPDQVISPTRRAEISQMESDLDEGYGVDK